MTDERPPGAEPNGGLSGAEFAGVGLQFAAALILFLYVGQWIDRKVGTSGVFTLLGVFVGGGAAFWNLYRKIVAAQRKDDEERKRR